MPLRSLLLAAALLTALLTPLPAAAAQTEVSRADRDLHEGLVVLDTHFDTPALFSRPGWSMMDRHSVAMDGSQVDYPRMVQGGVDGGFFVVYTPQGPRTAAGNAAARDAALIRAVEIREMVAGHPNQFVLVTRPDQIDAVVKAKKRFVFMSMENSYPLEADLSLMTTFYALGVRMMGPVHFSNNDLGDSATDPKGPEWHGLSPLGKQFVAEANRLGIVLDASHASDEVLEQMLALSKAPIILSHTGARAIWNHPRNIDDAHMKALAAKGGVIQLNAFSAYMIDAPANPARTAALADLAKTYPAKRTQAQQIAYSADRAAIDLKYPAPRADFDAFMKHLLHAIQVAGVDHVGISGDFDGGGGVTGFDDVTAYPKVTARLRAAGFSRDDIGKIWGGNALRVVREAQALAAKPN